MNSVQVTILKCFGFLPLHRTESYSGYVCISLAVCLLLGTLGWTCLQTARIAVGFGDTQKSWGNYDRNTGILQVMEMLPFWAINVRSFLVLAAVFVKRKAWSKLMQKAVSLLELCHTSDPIRKAIRANMWRVSMIGFLVTFWLHVIWETIDWAYFVGDWVPGITLTSDNVLAPFPTKLTTWKYILYYISFCIVPFILSQQVYLCAVILANFVKDALETVKQEISHEQAALEVPLECCHLPESRKVLRRLQEKVSTWKVIHSKTVSLTRAINEFFGFIFLVVYSLSVVSMLGFASWLMTNKSTHWSSYAFPIGSVLLFGGYTTAMPLPFAKTYELGTGLDEAVYFLTYSVKQKFGVNQVSLTLTEDLRQFEIACREYVSSYTGMGIITISYDLLIGTWTLVITFMLLAREVLLRN